MLVLDDVDVVAGVLGIGGTVEALGEIWETLFGAMAEDEEGAKDAGT